MTAATELGITRGMGREGGYPTWEKENYARKGFQFLSQLYGGCFGIGADLVGRPLRNTGVPDNVLMPDALFFTTGGVWRLTMMAVFKLGWYGNGVGRMLKEMAVVTETLRTEPVCFLEALPDYLRQAVNPFPGKIVVPEDREIEVVLVSPDAHYPRRGSPFRVSSVRLGIDGNMD